MRHNASGKAWVWIGIVLLLVVLAGGSLLVYLFWPHSIEEIRVEGVVRLNDGTPATGATVFAGNWRLCVSLSKTKPYNCYAGGKEGIKVGEDGRFSMTLYKKPLAVMVVHEQGYAYVGINEYLVPISLSLKPWGRVEGTVKLGNEPQKKTGLDAESTLDLPDADVTLIFRATARSEDDGHFVMEALTEGDWLIKRSVKGSWHCDGYFSVRSGETAQVTVGGVGMPVCGKIVTSQGAVPFASGEGGNEPEEGATQEWSPPKNLVEGDVWSIPQSVPVPKDLDEAAKRKWFRDWCATPTGQDWRRHQYKYSIHMEEDGSFLIAEMIPGQYELQVNASVLDKGKGCRTTVGRGRKTIDVPALQSPQDSPFDIGEVILESSEKMKQLTRGDSAPDFTAQTLLGESIRLTDYRGKFVLLHFWSTTCGPCRKEMPNIKKIADHYTQDGRLVVVGVCSDEHRETALNYVEKNQLNWPQVFEIGMWNHQISQRYGIIGIPTIFLIDPDGKIISDDPRGAQIERAVKKALR